MEFLDQKRKPITSTVDCGLDLYKFVLDAYSNGSSFNTWKEVLMLTQFNLKGKV